MAKTYVLTARYDIEDIATLAAFMEQGGLRVTNRSQPACEGVKMMAAIIRQNHPSLTFDLGQAFEFLSGLGIDIMKGNRGAKALAKELQHTELGVYLNQDEPKAPTYTNDAEVVLSAEDKTMIEERRDQELNDQMKAFKNITGMVDIEDD